MRVNKRHQLSVQIARIIGFAMILLIIFQIVYTVNYYRTREAHFEDTGEVIAHSIEVAMTSILDDIKSSSLAFAFSEDVGDFVVSTNIGERYDLIQKISELTRFVCNYNTEIVNVILISGNENVYAFKEDISNMVSEKIYGDFSKTMFLDGETELFFANHTVKEDSLDLMVFRTPVYAKTLESNLFYERNGVILFEMKTDGLYRLIRENQQYSEISITITDRYDNKIKLGDVIDRSMEHLVAEVTIEEYDLYIQVTMPKYYFNSESRYFFTWLVVTVVIFSIMVFLIGYVVYSRITSPIDRLLDEIKELHIGSDKKYVVSDGNDVAGVIADEINILMDKNREQTKNIMETQSRLFESEISEREAQFHALQLQINPHFLYNTLSCIKAMALMHEETDIASMITSMTRIFRYSIRKEKYVTVKDEINFIDEYLRIMRVRFEDKYEFTLDMDSTLESCRSLKMILQPVIENAVEHGLEQQLKPGYVKVSVLSDLDRLIYKVIDNGIGFSKERLKELTDLLEGEKAEDPESSIGLINVHRRLRNNFGNGCGIKIERREGETIVSLIQPLQAI